MIAISRLWSEEAELEIAHKLGEMCTSYPNYAQVEIRNHRYDKNKLFRYTKQSVSSLDRSKRGLFLV